MENTDTFILQKYIDKYISDSSVTDNKENWLQDIMMTICNIRQVTAREDD